MTNLSKYFHFESLEHVKSRIRIELQTADGRWWIASRLATNEIRGLKEVWRVRSISQTMTCQIKKQRQQTPYDTYHVVRKRNGLFYLSCCHIWPWNSHVCKHFIIAGSRSWRREYDYHVLITCKCKVHYSSRCGRVYLGFNRLCNCGNLKLERQRDQFSIKEDLDEGSL